jgi:hypothetical protein
VDGSDLTAVERHLLAHLDHFARDWQVPTARVINDKAERTPDLPPDHLPEWNLGLNLEVDSLSREKIEELVRFLSTLARETGRDFVIGYWDPANRISEDWCFIGAEPKQDVVEFLCEQIARSPLTARC